jgi:hypothetical protein
LEALIFLGLSFRADASIATKFEKFKEHRGMHGILRRYKRILNYGQAAFRSCSMRAAFLGVNKSLVGYK